MHAAAPLQLSLDLTNKAELWATELANQDKEKIDVNSKFGQNIFTSTKEAKDAVTQRCNRGIIKSDFTIFTARRGRSSRLISRSWCGWGRKKLE